MITVKGSAGADAPLAQPSLTPQPETLEPLELPGCSGGCLPVASLAGGAAVPQLRATCSAAPSRRAHTHHWSCTNTGHVLGVLGLTSPTSLCDHQRWVCTVTSNSCHRVNSEWIFAPQLSLKVCVRLPSYLLSGHCFPN